MSLNIEKYLIELMYQHDCVVIPNLGGLVANYTPGFLDKRSHLLSPPKKSFVWNKFLQHNDGLVAHEISKQTELSYDEAIKRLEEYTTQIKLSLKENKRFEFDSIGVLFLDGNSGISFKPKKEDYLLYSFGLPMVKAAQLTAVEVVSKEPIVKEEIVATKGDEETIESNKLGKVISIQEPVQPKVKVVGSKWWIAAALIPIGFYSAWIPMKTDLLNGSGNFQYSDLNPFSYSKVEKIYNATNITFYSIDSTNTVDFDVFDAYYQAKDVFDTANDIYAAESTFVDVSEPELNYVADNANSKSYFVIGGCFSDEANAINFVNQLKGEGYQAVLVDVNKGLHRVAFGKYGSSKEAKAAKESISSSGVYSAWVLKK